MDTLRSLTSSAASSSANNWTTLPGPARATSPKAARFKHKEFVQFVRIAKGSEAEVLNHLIDAGDQRLLTRDEFLLEEHLVKRALKAANGLIRVLESTPDPPLPPWKPKPPKAP